MESTSSLTFFNCFMLLNLLVPMLAIPLTNSPSVSLRVEMTLGAVWGTLAGNSKAFLGIPYAQPPVGLLRWMEPQEKTPWAPEVYQATKDAPGCPQICNDPPSGCPSEISEDCLHLNIFVPSNPRVPGPLPVMVFLHGGNFQSGGNSADMYDGRFLASEADTIVVVPNYRLGALGYLYITEKGNDISGNFGLKDQQLALKFVQENIDRFGGDPKRVTLVGQSAGAESAAIHYLDPDVSQNFSQVVMLSNPFVLPLKTPLDGNKFSKIFLRNLECNLDSNTMECLQSKSFKDILNAQMLTNKEIVNKKQIFQFFQPWGPIVEHQPIERFSSEKFEHKPVMMGSLSEEGRLFVYEAFKQQVLSPSYVLQISLLVPGHSEDILRHYPRTGGFFFRRRDERDVLSNLITDYMFTCSGLQVAKELSTNEHPVFHYVVDQALSFGEGWEKFTWCDGHACHGGDLAYLFRTAPLVGYSYTTAERDMMDKMTSYLGSFFHNGNPNIRYHTSIVGSQTNLPEWNPIGKSEGNGPTIIFSGSAKGTRIVQEYNSDKCLFWDRIGYFGVNNVNGF